MNVLYTGLQEYYCNMKYGNVRKTSGIYLTELKPLTLFHDTF